MSVLRFGIVGCGGMASNSHVNGFQLIEEKCRVAAACDIIPERANALAEKLNVPFVTTDYRELIGHVDAVLIALPHHLHYEAGLFFLTHGVHVLLEKPLCNTEEQCLELVRVAEERKLTLMCAYPVPYWQEVVKLKELLDSGEYGEIFQMSIWTEQLTTADNFPWAKKAELLGGGQLFSHGCHYIDILLRFLGKPVSGVHVGSNKGTPWMEREGTSNVIMTFENGAMGYHFGTWGARGTSHGYNFQVFTDKGFFEYSRADSKLRFKCDLDPNTVGPKQIEWSFGDSSKQTQYEITHFIDCLQTGKRPLTDGRTAIESLRVIWRLYEAEEKGCIADLRGLGF